MVEPSNASASALVACRGARVEYRNGASKHRALDAVTVEVFRNDSLAVSGRSGSGKSTLLQVLGGLTEPTVGSVEWQGQPLATLDATARGAARARGMGYVFQGANLLPYFTAIENVAFAADVAHSSEPPGLSADDMLVLVGLAAKADHLPSELSGGEAQRVAIARALVQAPELLLCDEPTGHLDSDTAERVLDLIAALRNELGFALVVATHDVDIAARLTRSIELEDGRIVYGDRR
jgi:lipoprotein-releasing system ATP-binding protein